MLILHAVLNVETVGRKTIYPGEVRLLLQATPLPPFLKDRITSLRPSKSEDRKARPVCEILEIQNSSERTLTALSVQTAVLYLQ